TIELQHKPPSPARGVLTSTRLTADTSFDDWTPFREGIRQTLAWALAEREGGS
ncbi:MAG: epimerase, partial [Chitinophagaceae bacterium]|nr:epimerase [Anaerolineae bacterium]